jgi:carboxylate-amine ligase
MPRSGLPPVFADYASFAGVLERLAQAGAVLDHSYVWWDARPHPRFGTVELRCMDVQPSVEDSAAIGGLVQALVRHYGQRYERGERFADADRFVVSENRWLAARHGLSAPLVRSGLGSSATARTLLAELLERVSDDADAVGASWALERVQAILQGGTSADRQLHLARQGCDLEAILASLADETERVSA